MGTHPRATSWPRRRVSHTYALYSTRAASIAFMLLVPALAGSLASGGCQRPGVSLSADPSQAPIFQTSSLGVATPTHTAATTAFPLAGAIGIMVLAITGLVVVVLGFRLVRQLALASNNRTPPTPAA